MLEKLPTTETDQTKAKGEIQLEEVAELEAPIKVIIEKIKDRIERGEYGLIIGDDASGRVPTRILGDFIQKVCDSKGLYKPNIVFMPGKLEKEMESFWSKIKIEENAAQKQRQELDDYLTSRGAVKERRVLIITDTLKTGVSLKTLVELLRETGYGCDIATMGIEQPIIGQGIKESLRGIDIFSGEYRRNDNPDNSNTPKIYENKKMSGVSKSFGELKSQRLVDGVDTVLERDLIQFSIEQSRKDSKLLTNKLVDWYLHPENKK